MRIVKKVEDSQYVSCDLARAKYQKKRLVNRTS